MEANAPGSDGDCDSDGLIVRTLQQWSLKPHPYTRIKTVPFCWLVPWPFAGGFEINAGIAVVKALSKKDNNWLSIGQGLSRDIFMTEINIYLKSFKKTSSRLPENKGKYVFEEYIYWYIRAESFRKSCLYRVAIANYMRSIEYHPNCYKAFYNIARCYAVLNNSAAALKNLKSAIALNPDECFQKAIKDSDFNYIRENQDFQNLFS